MIERKPTKGIQVGTVHIGDNAPVSCGYPF